MLAHPSADPDVLRTALIRGVVRVLRARSARPSSRAYVPASDCGTRSATTWSPRPRRCAVGDVRDFGNFTSAVIDRRAFTKQSGAIERGQAVDPATGDRRRRADRRQRGLVRPADRSSPATNPRNEVFTTEYFGPILGVYVYDDAGDQLRPTSWPRSTPATPYGLTGAVLAEDRAALAQASAALRFTAGNFYLNDKPTGAVVGQQPFGGSRRLRHQRQGRLAVEPDPLDQPPLDQGDPGPADAPTATRTRADHLPEQQGTLRDR